MKLHRLLTKTSSVSVHNSNNSSSSSMQTYGGDRNDSMGPRKSTSPPHPFPILHFHYPPLPTPTTAPLIASHHADRYCRIVVKPQRQVQDMRYPIAGSPKAAVKQERMQATRTRVGSLTGFGWATCCSALLVNSIVFPRLQLPFAHLTTRLPGNRVTERAHLIAKVSSCVLGLRLIGRVTSPPPRQD